ncbi:uncharacterized protein LOC115309341 [Ixodes scapularis]|uniref:uncharacterized protein LOC115309341 n=1 Tax=Ixodes scapularis TaxID=6945 RepID=UPI001C37F41A|nr:uncharacterized protein LOC115309341 [Ixodes scapularis]
MAICGFSRLRTRQGCVRSLVGIIIFALVYVTTICFMQNRTVWFANYGHKFHMVPKQTVNPLSTRDPDLRWDGQVEDFIYPDNAIYIVPNIVHFIKFGDDPLSFIEVICIRAAWLQQRPDALMIHCDHCNAIVESPLWYLIEGVPTLQLELTERPTEVFGIPFSCVQHAADVARALILMNYGGIYLDSDSYLVKSLNPYRSYEMSIGWPPGENVGIQVLVAHKDARYLRLWYESYRAYRPDLWYWNAGELPTKKFLSIRPDLVNRVRYDFGVAEEATLTLYDQCDDSWGNYSSFHTFFRHIFRYVPSEPERFGPLTLDTVPYYDRNFGQMARLVLFGTTRLGANELRSVDWLSRHGLEYSEHGCVQADEES